MKSVTLVLVILVLVASQALITARTILQPIEHGGASGWVVTVPGADQTGYVALPRLFAPDRQGLLGELSGVGLVVLLVVSAAFAAYTIRIGYRGGPPSRGRWS